MFSQELLCEVVHTTQTTVAAVLFQMVVFPAKPRRRIMTALSSAKPSTQRTLEAHHAKISSHSHRRSGSAGPDVAGPTAAQSEADQQLGNVHFETSCNEVAQRRFDRAMRYQHSFWYSAAKEIFEEVAKADPNAAWRIGASRCRFSTIRTPRSRAPNLAPGLAAIQKAKAVGAKTERERDYIDALTLMYVDHDKLSHSQRIRAFLGAMEKLAAKYPKDDEAQIAYAITLNTSASPPTRPMPSRPRARRSWSRSRSGCRSTRASRIT